MNTETSKQIAQRLDTDNEKLRADLAAANERAEQAERGRGEARADLTDADTVTEHLKEPVNRAVASRTPR